ncbi:hypothetical protein [Archangium sp.]|uniref:hypothetical protein n=1 Tax=Archangium sp. TaxID=1872627 RepID=UPI002EDAFCEB
MTKTRKGLPFIKFELPKLKKPGSKPPDKPEKPRPTDRLTTQMVGEEGAQGGS